MARRGRHASRDGGSSALNIEELEPRLLLSADAATLFAPDTFATQQPVTDILLDDNFERVNQTPVSADHDDEHPGDVARVDEAAPDELSGTLDTAAFSANYLNTPLAFEANMGQFDTQLDYLARGSGYSLLLSDGDAVVMLQDEDGGHTVRLDLVGGNSEAAVRGEDLLDSYSNYLIGNDSAAWQSNVANHAAVVYSEVYNGIDVRYYGNQRQFEYDFIVAPGADASQIQLSFDGVASTSLADNGDLLLVLNEKGDQISFQAPIAFQLADDGSRESVASHYLIHEDGTIGFAVGEYDESRTLVIDPILSWTSYFGGTGTESARDIAVDASGNIYITGSSSVPSPSLPITDGPFGSPGAQDAYVAKFSNDGSTLLYSTYFGGGSADTAVGIVVDSAGEIYVAGDTYSNDFPTPNGKETSRTGSKDSFVVKLNAAGTSLVYGSYLGGGGPNGESAGGIALDPSGAGRVVVAGDTDSDDLPFFNAYDDELGGTYDGFIAAYDTTQTGNDSLLFLSYFGGSNGGGGTGNESLEALAVDAAGNIYISGHTSSTSEFPLSANAYDATAPTNNDAYITKLKWNGGASWSTLYSSYIASDAGLSSDRGEAIAVDGSGYIYLTGKVTSTGFPTKNAYDISHNGGNDVFIAKFDPGAATGPDSLVYSTYFGGGGTDTVNGIAVDGSGRAYVVGYTGSGNLPLTGDAHDNLLSGTTDAYVAILGAAGNTLTYSTYLGGDATETGYAIALDGSDNIYIAGNTGSINGLATGGAYDTTYNGSTDGFVAKLTAAANAAPVLDTLGTMALTDVAENATDPAGDTVAAVIASAGGDRITDTDGGALEGIAVIGVDDTDGTWEYSTNGGSSWTPFGGINNTTAVLLDPAAKLRFVPDAAYTGPAGDITFHAWDQTFGVNGQTGVNLLVTGTGGTTAFSVANETATLNVVADSGQVLWVSTEEDVFSPSGWNGLATEAIGGSEIIQFTGPGLGFESGTGATSGTFSRALDFAPDVVSGATRINALHYVGQNMTVGTNSISLLAGDVLFSFFDSGTHTLQNSDVTTTDVDNNDVVLFRPDTPGDYSSGMYSMLVDGSDVGINSIIGLTLVEQSTTVGQDGGATVLDAGDFLLVEWDGGAETGHIQRFQPGTLGSPTTGSFSVLVDVNDLSTNLSVDSVVGIDLVETDTAIGGSLLQSGQILMTLVEPDDVGGVTAGEHDIIILDVTTTGTNSVATAELFFEGIDVGLDNWREDLRGLSLGEEYTPPRFSNFTVNSTPGISEDLAQTATFTVTLSGDALVGGETASVDIIASGSAASGTDYDNFIAAVTTAAGLTTGVTFDGTDTLTFDSTFNGGAGLGAFAFSVDAIDDPAVEGTENIVATLSNPSATHGPAGIGPLSDSFTESSNKIITAHTPDNGLLWTKVFDNSSYEQAFVDAGLDVIQGGFRASSENDTGQAYAASPVPASADQNISFTLSAIETDNGTKPVGLFGRSIDNDNFYYLRILPNTNGQDSISLWKMVAGSPTQLTSIDATIAAGDTFELELTDGAKKVYHNGSEVLSSADNALTAAGNWGFFIGNYNGVGGHYRDTWKIDDFLASDSSGAAATTTNITETDTNIVPVVTASGGNTAYSEQATALAIDSAITLADADGNSGTDPSNAYTAAIQVTGNYTAADILGFTDTADIEGNLVGDTLTLSVIGGQTASVADFQAALRSVTFYNGSDTPSELDRTVSFTFNDGLADSNTTTKVVEVTALNDGPTITSTAGTTATEDTLYTYTATVSDPDDANNGTDLTWSLSGEPAGMVVSSTGVVTWTPTEGVTTSGAVTLTVSDGNEDGAVDDTEVFTITVTPVNDGPTITSTAGTTATEDTLYTYTATVSDPDDANNGTDLTWSLSGEPAGMVVSSTGVVTWTPTEGVTTSGAVTLTVSDGNEDGAVDDTEVFTITVTPVNDGPTITSTAGTTATEDTLYTYTATVSDPDDANNGTDLTWSLSGEPAGMVVSSTGVVTWTPTEGVTTSGAVTLTVSDGNEDGAVDATEIFTITVTPVNDGPTITSTAGTTATEDTLYTYTATVLDPDDANNGTDLTWSLSGEPAGMVVSSTGVVTWTPTEGVTTSGSVTLTVSDGNEDGAVDASEVFTITVTPVNDGPTITSTAGTTATEDTLYTYTATVSDPDDANNGTDLTWSLSGQPAGMVVSSTGVVTWTPTEGVTTSGAVTLTVSDGNEDGAVDDTEVFTVTVTPVNDGPTITSTAGTTATEDTLYTYTATVSDPDDANNGTDLTWSLSGQPAGMVVSSTGVVTWTPTEGVTTSGAVTLTVSDGNEDGAVDDTEVFTVTVTPVNDGPTITSTAGTTATEDTLYTYTATVSDPDDANNGTDLTWSLSGEPAGMVVSSTGVVTWTPTEGVTTSGAVTLTVSDGNEDGAVDDTEIFTVNVTPVNDGPTITSTAGTTATEDTLYTYTATVLDPDDANNGTDLTWSLSGEPAGMVVSSTGVVTWTPTEGVTTSGAVTLTVSDGNEDGAVDDTEVFTITVTPVNDGPTITSTAGTTATEDTLYTYTATVSDPDDANNGTDLTWSLSGEPAGMVVSSTGVVTWTPTEGVTTSGAVTLTVSDGNEDGAVDDTEVFTITVTPVNDGPTITSTAGTTATEDTLYTYTATVSDPDDANNGTDLTWSLSGEPAGMVVSSTGVVTWTPTEGVTTSGSVTLTVSDGNEDGAVDNTEVFTVTVTPVNDGPTITSTAGTTATEDTLYTYTATVSDPDDANNGTDLTWSLSGEPAGMVVSSTGVVTWTPTEGVTTSGAVTLTVSDGNEDGAVDATEIFTITVTPVNDPPTGLVLIDNMSPAQGTLLTASDSLADDDGLGPITYQWFRGVNPVSIASGSTYTTVVADVGETLRVEASYTDLGGTNEMVSSASTAPVSNTNDSPTGSVTISGVPTEDQVLTAANTLADADGLGTITYQWFRGATPVGTGTTYTLGQADVGATISVTASYTDGGGFAENVNSAPVGPIANVNDLPAGIPTITGAATEDVTLTADTTGISDEDGLGTFSYQWQRSTDGGTIWNDVGANSVNYTLGDADVGAVMRVQVSYTDSQLTPEGPLNSAQTAVVTNINDAPTGLVLIDNMSPAQGALLTASNTLADEDGLGPITYQWFRGTNPVSIASGITYTTVVADVGETLRVEASYTDGQGTPETVSSASTAPVSNTNDSPTGTVSISGTPTEDQVLTASNTLADADGLGVITYQWFRGVTPVGTGTTYTLGQADVGATMTVTASYTDGGGFAESVSSAGLGPIANVNDAPTGSVLIDNMSPSQGTLLSASNTLADEDGLGPITYQWFRGATAVGTGITYTTVVADVGQTLRVEASYTDGQGTPETVSSASTAPVSNTNDSPTGSVTISGTPAEDQVLTASNTLADADGLGPITYQWFRGATPVGTGTTYTLGQADVGATMTVTASYTDGGGFAESVSSAGLGPVANVNDAPTGSVLIDNMSPSQGTLLSASNTLADEDGLGPITYQWFRGATAVGTGITYTTVAADVGQTLRVEASYTDGQGTPETVSSASTAPVSNTNDSPTGSVAISGVPAEDQVLTAANTLADSDGLGPITYQWFRGATPVGTGTTYTLGQADVGATMTVTASYTDGGGTSESVSSAVVGPVANVNDLPSGIPTTSGTAQEGVTLSAGTVGINDEDGLGAFTYQWLRDNVAIGGATASTYTLASADVGGRISVQVRFTDGQGTPEGPLASAQTAVVTPLAPGNSAPTGSVVISGLPTEDEVLSVSNTLADDNGLGTISYQWLRNGLVVGGATGTSYTLTGADVGATMTVLASYTDGDGFSESVGSAGVGPIAAAAVPEPTPEEPPVEPPTEEPPVEPPTEEPPVEPPTEEPPVEPPTEQPPVEEPPVQPPVEPPADEPPVTAVAPVPPNDPVADPDDDTPPASEPVGDTPTTTPDEGSDTPDTATEIVVTEQIAETSTEDIRVGGSTRVGRTIEAEIAQGIPEAVLELIEATEDDGTPPIEPVRQPALTDGFKRTPITPLELQRVTGDALKRVELAKVNAVLNNPAMWQGIDAMKQQLDAMDRHSDEFVVEVVSNTGIGLMAGLVAYALRGGALLASLLSTMPLWSSYDPLPVLASKKKDEDEEPDTDEELVGRAADALFE